MAGPVLARSQNAIRVDIEASGHHLIADEPLLLFPADPQRPGKRVDRALTMLRFTPLSAAKAIEKILRSAAANAENNFSMKPDDLVIAKAVVDAAAAELDRLAGGRYRILIVDDNSPDGTGSIADRLAERREAVEVLHRPVKAGLGPAYLAGFELVLARGAELIFEMDADFSHHPRYLGDLLAAAQSADLVLGSRYVAGGGVRDWGLLRRLISRGGGIYARTMLGVDVQDLTGGFKCIRREVLESIDLPSVRSTGYAFQIELTYRTLKRGFTKDSYLFEWRKTVLDGKTERRSGAIELLGEPPRFFIRPKVEFRSLSHQPYCLTRSLRLAGFISAHILPLSTRASACAA